MRDTEVACQVERVLGMDTSPFLVSQYLKNVYTARGM